MALQWQFVGDRPIYAQLVEQIEGAIVTGVFVPGARLPGVRELAAEAGVNPNTMQRALAQLEDGGLVFSKRTSGRFVTEDAQRIAALRQALAKSLTGRYLDSMQALGLSAQDILQMVQQGAPSNHSEEEDI